MSDLVNRLRNDPAWDQFQASMLMVQAADRIDHLERVLAQAREALHNMVEDGDATDRAQALSSIAAIDEALNYQNQDNHAI